MGKSFIQMWDSKRLPASIRALLPEYSGQDVVFVPRKSPQKFIMDGEVEIRPPIETEKTLYGFDYQIEPGFFTLGKNLKVNIK